MTCPVCRRIVQPTAAGNLYRHRDKAENHCPGSGFPSWRLEQW